MRRAVVLLLVVACAGLSLASPAAAADEAAPGVKVPAGTLREFVEPAPLASASAEARALWPQVRAGLLKEAGKPVLKIADQNESGFFIMGNRMLPLMEAYAYSRDEAFIEALVPILENLFIERYVQPTQPQVWSGWWHYKDSTLKYMPIHAAIMYYRPVILLAAAVRADEKLKARYGEKVERWLKDITEVSIPAWDKRGCWHDLGLKGGFYTHTTHYPDAATGEIVLRDDLYAGSTLAYNKVHSFLQALVLLYRMTGDPWYRRRVEKCETFFRDHWRRKNDHVEWNYRDFSGPWDYKNGKDGATKTGYFIHPKGGYYAADLEAVVDCYDAGIVFTEDDIKALLKTNLEFMWMGDKQDPKFRKINGSYTAEGKYGKGHLWTSLARFSPLTRELWKAQVDKARAARQWNWPSMALGYLVATARPVSMAPRNAADVPQWP